jgi:hypothetical protein
MATILFSTLTNGRTIGFDPLVDFLNFDSTERDLRRLNLFVVPYKVCTRQPRSRHNAVSFQT